MSTRSFFLIVPHHDDLRIPGKALLQAYHGVFPRNGDAHIPSCRRASKAVRLAAAAGSLPIFLGPHVLDPRPLGYGDLLNHPGETTNLILGVADDLSRPSLGPGLLVAAVAYFQLEVQPGSDLVVVGLVQRIIGIVEVPFGKDS